ncbi:hypothetical protein ASPBRDRAFT_26457 [Aspergillus brasiliensis CBS 101740]|uniref:Extracellular membrane protein CFEM domain-containing protein n=1 Tax=Aspergillus brasiliensis (strain CBS 101740 / IMI 381727 / IBT 21946) TaxID=767769 RepID=A0A1L9UW59_ASPBC|nr:hypothetical protein ASPBRDRAFT_26457 [Aspergillus brasiliensis CBS 101740]
MHNLLLLSTLSLAAATSTTTNGDLGYLQCASSIAKTYPRNAGCTSPSALDCFCNAPFDPSSLDQDTLDNCASEGVSPSNIPDYVCSDTDVPIDARKGSSPMMRVDTTTSNASNTNGIGNGNKNGNGNGNANGNGNGNKNGNSNSNGNGNKPSPKHTITNQTQKDTKTDKKRAYAPDPNTDSESSLDTDTDTTQDSSTSDSSPDSEKRIEATTETQTSTKTEEEARQESTSATITEHHGVHMTDASNANVVYKFYTETVTDCACDYPPSATDAQAHDAHDASEVRMESEAVPATATATASTSARLFGTQAVYASGSSSGVVAPSSVVMSLPSGVDASRIDGGGSNDTTGAMFQGSAVRGGIDGMLMAVGMGVVGVVVLVL